MSSSPAPRHTVSGVSALLHAAAETDTADLWNNIAHWHALTNRVDEFAAFLQSSGNAAANASLASRVASWQRDLVFSAPELIYTTWRKVSLDILAQMVSNAELRQRWITLINAPVVVPK